MVKWRKTADKLAVNARIEQLWEKGREACLKGRFAEAENIFEEILRLNEDDPLAIQWINEISKHVKKMQEGEQRD